MKKVHIVKYVQSWQPGTVVDVAGGLADFLLDKGFAVLAEPDERSTNAVPLNKKVDTKKIKQKAK